MDQARFEALLAAVAVRENERQIYFKKILKPNVIKALAEAHIGTVVINFDGEGDSGQITDTTAYIEAFDRDGERFLPDDLSTVSIPEDVMVLVGFDGQEWSLAQAVEELVYGFLNSEYGGWENNDGAFGQFHIHVAKGEIHLEHNTRVMTTETENSVF